jgi:hypothetical protein
MTKKEIIRKFGDKDGVIENMDPAAFESCCKPNGEIALHTESADVKDCILMVLLINLF